MKRLLLALFCCSSKLFALEFQISPSLKYDLTKDVFSKTEDETADSQNGVSPKSIKRTGPIIGINAGVISPFVRHNWLNSAKLYFGYGLLTGFNDKASSDAQETNDLKLWQLNFEDTLSFYATVNSRTAPYIGVGYSYEKYKINDASFAKDPAIAGNNDVISEGYNKRFYIPVGFLVHATKNITLDARFEKDFGEKYNESEVYFKPLVAVTPHRNFLRGAGLAVAINWDFAPRNNSGITLKYMRHQARFGDATISIDEQKFQKQTHDSVMLQYHWLGNN